MNDRFLGFRTLHIDRHLFGIGTVIIECLHRGLSFRNRVIQVTISRIIFQGRIVSIRIGAVTTAIDIAIDSGIDTHSTTTGDTAGDIITSINVVDMST